MSRNIDEVLGHVTKFADRSHGSQVRKYTGERYTAHPVRVMEMTRDFNGEIHVLAAALLHDVLEDTPITADQIRAHLQQVMSASEAEKTVDLVVELTDVFIKNNYPRMNRRSRKEKEAHRLGQVSPAAQTIKYADIIDNVTDIVAQDSDFAKVFVSEAKRILSAMQKGDPLLRQRAEALVDRCLQELQPPAALY